MNRQSLSTPRRPPKPSPNPSTAYDWLLGTASGPIGRHAIRTALQTTPPEHIPLVGNALASVANTGNFPETHREHPPTSDEMAKAIMTLQETQGGAHWEPVRQAMSALLGTTVPKQVGTDGFFSLGLYQARAFLSAITALVG
jgi:hypothetical protein